MASCITIFMFPEAKKTILAKIYYNIELLAQTFKCDYKNDFKNNFLSQGKRFA